MGRFMFYKGLFMFCGGRFVFYGGRFMFYERRFVFCRGRFMFLTGSGEYRSGLAGIYQSGRETRTQGMPAACRDGPLRRAGDDFRLSDFPTFDL
jgi:hypothetical protein